MTHEREGATVLAFGAIAVLAADLAYVATRWTGIHSSFGHGFVGGAGCATVGLTIIVLVFPGPRPIGPDRAKARRRAAITNGAMTLLIFAVVLALSRLGGSLIGTLLGLAGPSLSVFGTYALWTALRFRIRPSGSS